jgi:membrane-associated phospholipid phosphatase
VVSGVPGVPVCSGAAGKVREGRKSFPSGHTSLATAGLGYLSFFLLANVRSRADTGSGAVWRTLAALSPLFLATWIGISRVRDYWHHWSDVATGGLLGAAIAFLCLRTIAPPRTAPSSLGGEAPAGGPGGGSEEAVLPGEP